MKKTLFAVAALVAGMSASAEVTPRTPVVPWGAQAEIIATNDLTQQNSDGSWSLTNGAKQWIEYSYDGTTENGTIQQTNRANLWFNYFSETTTTYKAYAEDGETIIDKEISCDEMIIGSAASNWGGYLTVTNKAGSTSGLIVVGANRYPHFFVTGTDKAKFYFSGSASKAGYPQIEVYEVGSETPVITKTGDIALTKSTWDKSTLLIADGLDKAKSYEIVCRSMNKVDDTTFGYEGGDIVLQVVKFYGDQAPMREDGLIISGSEIGNYINAHLTAYPEVTDFTLEGSGKYTITEGIVFNGGFTLEGDADAPATIDASGLSSVLFNMNAEPVFEPVESGQYVITKATKIANVKVTGLTKNFIATGGKAYAFDTFTVDNVVAQYNAQSGVVFNFSNGMAINFNITNSTFYSTEPGTGNFIALSGKRPWMITGYESETGKLTVANNTFYNVAKSKQFLNTNTLRGQQYLYVFNSNIFVDVSNKKIYGNMTNNANQVTTDGKNTYLFDGEFFAETNYNGDEGLQSDPGFKNADAGDFTVAANSQQAKYMTGDPRWKTPYATDAIKLEVDMGENTDWVKAINDALVESEAPSSITVQFFEAGEYPTTAELNTTSPITIQNGSDIGAGEATIVVNNGMTLGGQIKIDGVNIKAGAELTAPVITLQANEYKKLDNGFFDFGKIQLLNLKVENLKTQLINGIKGLEISEIETKNCEIYMADKIAGSGNTPAIYDFRQGGIPVTWNFVNSTLDANNNCIFSTAGGEKADAITNMQTLNISNSTILNPVKKAFQHRSNNQKWLRYILKNSIVVVNPEKPNFVAEMNAGSTGANPTWQITGNAFQVADAEGALVDASDKQNTGDEAEPVENSIAGTLVFDAEGFGGTFTLAADTKAPSSLGDPRWTINYIETITTFQVQPEVVYTYGQQITSVNDIVMTFGAATEEEHTGQYADFVAGVESEEIEGYIAMTNGNNANPKDANGKGFSDGKTMIMTNGTFYDFVPAVDGKLSVAVKMNANKSHFVTENGQTLLTTNTEAEDTRYGVIIFNVTAGKQYQVFSSGSKMGFFGFKFEAGEYVDDPSIPTGISLVENATVNNGVIYNLNGQKVQNAQKGLYIINGKKVVVK